MANVGAVVSSIRNIMRQDRGISGDAQRLEQLGWMLFLKIMDDKDQELEVLKDNYVSVIPEKFQWRTWATNPEGITGDELLAFIDNNAENDKGLFATLRNLTSITNPKRAAIVKEVFDGSNNYMKSGYEMRKVINKLNEIDFNNSDDKHIFGNIYESILQELRDAGNKGEYYTPRAVTQLMTQMTDPKLGEKVLDPAAGTGGFLTAAIDHVRTNYVKTVDDEHILQKSITGWELKPVAYVLGLTNLILHEMDVPDYHYVDSLKKEYNSIGKKDQVDVILANPPFGASIADGVETNFPATFRCKESADLFVVLMLQLLKPMGRCAIVLPDGSITGDGVKARIREKLLTDTNLHTIIRLPQSTFFPATVSTNLLFFEKGSPTKEIWYYEHRLPEGQKSYSKLKPVQFDEFAPILEWWNNRVESDLAWKVKVTDLKDWDLDINNPTEVINDLGDPGSHYLAYNKSDEILKEAILEIASELHLSKNDLLNKILVEHPHLFRNKEVVKILQQSILQEAIEGRLTNEWRKQNPNEENASLLLRRIEVEKERLIKEKQINRGKKQLSVEFRNTQFELPNSWIYADLDDITQFITDGTHQTPTYTQEGRIFLSAQNVKPFQFMPEKHKYITEEAFDEYTKGKKVEIGDLLVGRVGSKGETAVIDQDIEFAFYVSLGLIKTFKDYTSPKYLAIVMNSPYGNVYATSNMSSLGASAGNFNLGRIRSFPIPFPPLEEQKAIVQKVETLMEKCRALEAEIAQSEQLAQMLMQAVLKEAFEPKKGEV